MIFTHEAVARGADLFPNQSRHLDGLLRLFDYLSDIEYGHVQSCGLLFLLIRRRVLPEIPKLRSLL